MIKVINESEKNPLHLTKSQQQKWDFIIKNKGSDYLLAAIAHAFKDTDKHSFDRLIQNLFVSLAKDYKAGQRMAKARAEQDDTVELD